MKKIIAILLTLVMICSLATVAFAADVDYASSEETSFEITKTYTSTESFVPGETLSFTIEANSTNPDTTKLITIGTENKYTVSTDANAENKITVTVPSYDEVGTYRYTIKEVEGNTAGVTTYDTEKTIHVIVLVEYDNVNHKLVINNTACYIEDINGVKTSEFENVFETNDFTIAKDVQGNMANENDEFDVNVTFTTTDVIMTDIIVAGTTVNASDWVFSEGTYSYSTTVTVSESGGKVTVSDVPYGVTVDIEEDNSDKNMQGYVYMGGNTNFTIGDWETKDVVITNNKEASVETGIALDSAPYILILAVAAIGGVAIIGKKRYEV